MIHSSFEIFHSQIDGKFGYRLTDAGGATLLSHSGFVDREQCPACINLVKKMVCVPGQIRMENVPGQYRFLVFDQNNYCIGYGMYYKTRKIRELKRIVMLLIVSKSKENSIV